MAATDLFNLVLGFLIGMTVAQIAMAIINAYSDPFGERQIEKILQRIEQEKKLRAKKEDQCT